MHQPALKYITAEEYLALEDAADSKHEYYHGEIFAMAGASQNHNRLTVDLGTSANLALQGSQCELYMNDMKVWSKAKNFFAYPDVAIICGKAEFYEGRTDIITNPLVIFEVLSDSTKSFDYTEKFDFY